MRLTIAMKIRSAALLTVWLALSACSGGPTGPNFITTTTSATTTTVDSTVTTAPDASSGCQGDHIPVEAGDLLSADEAASDAEQISAIGWVGDAVCETFTIEFATDQGAPATTPPSVSAEFIREVGIVRVALDVQMTSITDQLAETGLVRQVFVARRDDRSLFVDLHLSSLALATVTTSSSPAQVIISLEPGGSDYIGSPAIGDNVVVLSPIEGPVVSPLSVNGYSRNFEANTIARISQGSNVLAERFTTAADWSETWGEFTLTLDVPGSGPADLFVGEQSAQDGSDRGVVVPIDLP